LRYQTSKGGDSWRGLQQYVSDMADKQQYIYYITGATLDTVKSSPFIERLRRRGFEVLYMTDPLDEYVVQQLPDFEGKKLMSVTKEGLKFGDENKEKLEKLEDEFKDVTTWLKGVYGERVEKVVISHRIDKAPCVLVTSQYGWTANMERIMKAQTFADNTQQDWMKSKKTMEINPRHPIIKELKRRSADAPEDKELATLAELMYDSALMVSGFQMDDVGTFSSRIHRVMSMNLKIDPDSVPEVEPLGEIQDEPAPEASSSSDDMQNEDMAEMLKNARAQAGAKDEL